MCGELSLAWSWTWACSGTWLIAGECSHTTLKKPSNHIAWRRRHAIVCLQTRRMELTSQAFPRLISILKVVWVETCSVLHKKRPDNLFNMLKSSPQRVLVVPRTLYYGDLARKVSFMINVCTSNAWFSVLENSPNQGICPPSNCSLLPDRKSGQGDLFH